MSLAAARGTLHTMPPIMDRASEWEAYQPAIEDLYWNEWKELPEVMNIMKAKHGFIATKKQYKKQLKIWGYEKNIKAHDMIALLRIKKRRLVVENKETDFKRHGRVVPSEKLSRFRKRYKLADLDGPEFQPNERATTPPGIIYYTPEPEPLDCPLAVTREEARDFSEQLESEDEGESVVLHELVPGGSPRYESSDPDLSHPPRRWSSVDNPLNYPQLSPTIGPGCVEMSTRSLSAISSDFYPRLESGYSHTPSTMACFAQTPGTSASPSNPSGQEPDNSSDWIFNSFGPELHPPYSHISANTADNQYYGCPVDPSIHQNTPWINGLGSTAHDFSGFAPVSPIMDRGVGAQVESYPGQPMRNEDTAAPLTDHSVEDYNMGQESGDYRSCSQLHWAVIKGDTNLASTLLAGGANPSPVAFGGVTPLHCAVFQRNINLVNLLREYGANLDSVTDRGQSVLFFAVCSHNRLGCGDISSSGAEILKNTSISRTDENTVETINALFDRPDGWTRLLRSLDQADKEGVTPLMAAAEEGFFHTITMFLQRGIRPDRKDHAGYTALKYAASRNRRDLVRLLLEADPRVQAHNVSHMLKLVIRNMSPRDDVESFQHLQINQGYATSQWGAYHDASGMMLEEMVRLYHQMGVLDRLVKQAKQSGRLDVFEALIDASKREGVFS